MSAGDLVQWLKLRPVGAPIDWRKIREEIHYEHVRATTTEERVALLHIFKAVMDLVERSGLSPEDMEKFREARLKDYHSLIVGESLVGETICTETLDAITRREIEAGRMAPDDNLRQIAERGKAVPHLSRAELLEEEKRKATEQQAAILSPEQKPNSVVDVQRFNWLDRAEKSWPTWAVFAWVGAAISIHAVMQRLLGWLYGFIPTQPDLYLRYSELPPFLHGFVRLFARWYAVFLDLPAYGRQAVGLGYWIAIGISGLFLVAFVAGGFFTLARKITKRPPLEEIQRAIENAKEETPQQRLASCNEPEKPMPILSVQRSRHPMQTFLFRLAVFLTLPTWLFGAICLYGITTSASGDSGLFLFLIGLWNALIWGLYWVLCGLFQRST